MSDELSRSAPLDEPPYLTPLHSEVEKQIGTLCEREGDTTHLQWLTLANRCSQIIKGFEERFAFSEPAAAAPSAPLQRKEPPSGANAELVKRLRYRASVSSFTVLADLLREAADALERSGERKESK